MKINILATVGAALIVSAFVGCAGAKEETKPADAAPAAAPAAEAAPAAAAAPAPAAQ